MIILAVRAAVIMVLAGPQTCVSDTRLRDLAGALWGASEPVYAINVTPEIMAPFVYIPPESE
jgi:hypothetical protein